MSLLVIASIGCAFGVDRPVEVAQPTLPMIEVDVSGHMVQAEVADSEEERRVGLMFRKALAPDSGMLFVYPNEAHRSFWMMNTLVPLSIAYLDSTGLIVHITDMAPLDTTPVPSVKPAMYALEMEKGWFVERGVSVGERIGGLPTAPEPGK